jgi:hypothetical protein
MMTVMMSVARLAAHAIGHRFQQDLMGCEAFGVQNAA